MAYWDLSPKAAPGVDGVTWEDYGQDLAGNLRDLHDRVHRGRYQARPSRAGVIPKADGRLRQLGIATVSSYCPSCRRVWGYFRLAGPVLAGTGFAGSLAVSMAGGTDTIGRPGVAWCGGRPG